MNHTWNGLITSSLRVIGKEKWLLELRLFKPKDKLSSDYRKFFLQNGIFKWVKQHFGTLDLFLCLFSSVIKKNEISVFFFNLFDVRMLFCYLKDLRYMASSALPRAVTSCLMRPKSQALWHSREVPIDSSSSHVSVYMVGTFVHVLELSHCTWEGNTQWL